MDAPLTVILASGAVAAAVPTLVWGLAGIGRNRRRPKGTGLEEDGRRTLDEHQLRLEDSIGQRFFGPVGRGIGRAGRRQGQVARADGPVRDSRAGTFPVPASL